MWARAAAGMRQSARAALATAAAAAPSGHRRVAAATAAAMGGVALCAAAAVASSPSATATSDGITSSRSGSMSRWLRQLLPMLHPSSAHCADNSNGNNNGTGASSSDGDDDDYHKHTVATKTWHYYSGPGGELSNLRLFCGNSNRELATEIAHYLGIKVNAATVGKFVDGECKIQVHDNVRQTHCFVIQPTSSPVNDSLMELLLMVSTLRRASAAEITAVIPYYGYERADRKLSSRTPISAADVAIMLEEMGVDRVVAVDLHGGQIQGFFPPSIPVENLESMPIGALYFSEKHLRRPVVVAASAGGVLRAKRFRETLVEQGHDVDLALLIESRETDDAGRFDENDTGKLDLVGDVRGRDCILIEDIIDTASTMHHAAYELKRQGSRHVYGFCTHGLFSSPDSAQKIIDAPIRELVTTNTVRMRPAVERVDKITQLTLAPLLAETIRRVYQRRSISGLYASPITAPASTTTTTTTTTTTSANTALAADGRGRQA